MTFGHPKKHEDEEEEEEDDDDDGFIEYDRSRAMLFLALRFAWRSSFVNISLTKGSECGAQNRGAQASLNTNNPTVLTTAQLT